MDEASVSQAVVPPGAKRQRRLTVGDLLWIVIFAGLTLTLFRFTRAELIAELPLSRETQLTGEMMSVLFPLTVLTLILRLQRPRPRFRRVVRQRGSLACLAVIFGVLVNMSMLPVTQKTIGAMTPLITICWHWPGSLAGMVAGSWLLLYFMRGWPANSDWVDRLGIVIGPGWISVIGVMWGWRFMLH